MSWKLELSLPMLTLGLPSFLPPCPLVLFPPPTPCSPCSSLLSSSSASKRWGGRRRGRGREQGEGVYYRLYTLFYDSKLLHGWAWLRSFFSVTFVQVERCYMVGYNWCPATSSLGPHMKPQSYVCFVVPHWNGVICMNSSSLLDSDKENVVYIWGR